MEEFDIDYDDETCRALMHEFSEMSRIFSQKYDVSCLRMISLHLSLFTLGCAAIKMEDAIFKKLLVEVAKNFKTSKDEMHG